MTFDIVLFTDLTGQFYHNKPLGAYSLASTLRSHGYSVMVIDHLQRYLAEPNKLISIVKNVVGPNTLFIGFNTTFVTTGLPDIKSFTKWNDFNGGVPAVWPEAPRIKMLIRAVHSLNPNTKIVYGGAQATKTSLFEYGIDVDYVVQGYAEISAVKLADHLKKSTRLKTKKLHNSLLVDYDTLATGFNFSQHSTIYQPHDILLNNETLALETSRGCMYNCTFCDFPLRNRKRDDLSYHIDDTLLREYFIRNYELAGIVNYMITDDTFNETTDKLIRFKNVVKSTGLPLQFMCFARVDLLTKYPEQIEILQEAGIISIWMGLESLNQSSSNSVNKTYKVDTTKETILNIRKQAGNDFRMYASFIFGLPNETEKSIHTWMDWVINESTIDCIQVEPLTITPSNTPWPADIAVNMEQHGYQGNKNPNTMYVNWYNKVWTFEEADALALKYQQELWESGRNRLAAFHLFGMMSYGYKFDDIKNIPINQLPYNDIISKGQSQFKDYHNKMVSTLGI